MKRVVVLFGICLLAAKPCLAKHADLRVNKNFYHREDIVRVTLVNPGPEDLVLDDPLSWEVRDSFNNIVYLEPRRLALVPRGTPQVKGGTRVLRRHENAAFTWDLTYGDGKKVPPGEYQIIVHVRSEDHPRTVFKVEAGEPGAKRSAGSMSLAANLFGGLLSAVAPATPVMVPLFICEAASFVLAFRTGAYANDPPDSDFQRVVDIPEIQLPAMPSGTAIDSVARSYVRAALRLSAVVQALTQATERYQGAAKAGDQKWGAEHDRKIRSLADAIPGRLAEYNAATEQLARGISSLGLTQLPPDRWAAFQADVRAKGLPAEEIEFLKKVGMTDSEISLMANKAASTAVPANYDLTRATAQLRSAVSDSERAFGALLKYGR